MACGRNASSHDLALEVLTNRYVLPAEMLVGAAVQCLNLCVLQGRNIKGLSYTMYLKGLSVTYLLSVPFLIPALLRKTGNVQLTHYLLAFYHAHMEQYFVNLLLFSGNLIIVCLGVVPLRALLFPFQSLSNTGRGSRIVIVIIYAAVGVILLPTTLTYQVRPDHIRRENVTFLITGRNGSVTRVVQSHSVIETYCWETADIKWISNLRYIIVAIFESTLISLVIVVYFGLFIKYRSIAKHQAQSVKEGCRTSSRRQASNQKATAMCLGSITGFIICNVPSAVFETVNLISLHVMTRASFKMFHVNETRKTIRAVANIMLIANSSLTFFMQSLFSEHYRHQVKALILRRKTVDYVTTRRGTTIAMNMNQRNSSTPDWTQLKGTAV